MPHRSLCRFASLVGALFCLLLVVPGVARAVEAKLLLHARQRTEAQPDSGQFDVVNKPLTWDANQTAIVICDMWYKLWCAGATRRVAELAPRMNAAVRAARDRGVLIIHCPSGCMEAYQDTPMRKLAAQASPVETKVPLQSWCQINAEHEAPLPIDDADGGCDCWPPCQTQQAWKRQIADIEIKEGDAITDSAEAFYLMKQRGIENVIVMGVHTNMCVLGRPFSIRQMVYQGQNVVLMRDMTDTMYNSRSRPQVPHVQGTALVVEHIEKYWCPTIASSDFTGQPEFAFAEATQPHVVFVIGEHEYQTNETLPVFARQHLEPRGVRSTIVHVDAADPNNFPGLEVLKTADLLFVSVRRRALPEGQLALIREYVASGRPVAGIRTASHAFHTKGEHPAGHAEWQEFDPAILGGNYRGHHGNTIKSTLRVAEGAESSPILSGVSIDSLVGNGSLYQVSPLAKDAHPLLVGTIPDKPSEPVAWTRELQGQRIFYTSLGHADDFQNPDFNRFLANAVLWTLKK